MRCGGSEAGYPGAVRRGAAREPAGSRRWASARATAWPCCCATRSSSCRPRSRPCRSARARCRSTGIGAARRSPTCSPTAARRCSSLHADLWPALEGRVPDGVALVAWATGECPRRDPLGREWIAEQEPWLQAPEAAPVSIIYTSGTTGKPKGVVREQASEEKREETRAMLAEVFQLGEGERTVIPAPMYHTAPNVYALACALLGMDMTIMERFDPEEFLRIVQERRVTVVQMVPTMFVRLLALPREVRESYDVSSLRWVVHAAAPCPPDVKRQMIDWLGPIVAEYYGGTETGPVTYCTSEEWLAHPGTVGRPLANARVRVLGEDGAELPAGRVGRGLRLARRVPQLHLRGRRGEAPLDRARRARQRRRHRLPRRGGVPLPQRPPLVHGDQRRREHLPGGDRGLPARARGRARLRRVRDPGSGVRRGAGRPRRTRRGRSARRGRRARARARAASPPTRRRRWSCSRTRCRARTRARSSSAACASPTGPGMERAI